MSAFGSLSQRLEEAISKSDKTTEELEKALGVIAPAERIANRKTFSVGTPEERIVRGRALIQDTIDERFNELLAPHLAAFTQDKIDEKTSERGGYAIEDDDE